MKKMYCFIFLTVLLLSASSCVTKKKYLLAENGRLEALSQGEALKNQLVSCMDESNALSGRLEQLLVDTTAMGREIRHRQALLSSNLGEQDKLNALLHQKMEELTRREQTINELQEMINRQNERVQALLGSVKDALLGFGSDELTVEEKNGKVYVALSDKLLFESGSANVDKRGKEALSKLGGVLNKQTDIDVFIEGHTDTKPIHTVQFKDNWDLSVIRATSVVRILTREYGVSPLQIQPCGRGEFLPVATNETAEGRSRNRRTEIIMAPKLDKLLNILN
jgi:chemotaxis protein MotB